MRDELLGKLLPLLVKATSGDLAAIHRFLTRRQPLPDSQPAAHVFRRKGRLWEVIFAGGEPFYLQDTLGARYLNYLLHEPNQAISAFGLEVAVEPEKGEGRSRNSVQSKSDAQAQREYRQELGRLEADREAARAAGRRKVADGLDGQIAALKSALAEGGDVADTGERARVNVHKALKVVMRQLGKGGPQEKAFARHLEQALSLGYECLYSHPQGKVWG